MLCLSMGQIAATEPQLCLLDFSFSCSHYPGRCHNFQVERMLPLSSSRERNMSIIPSEHANTSSPLSSKNCEIHFSEFVQRCLACYHVWLMKPLALFCSVDSASHVLRVLLSFLLIFSLLQHTFDLGHVLPGKLDSVLEASTNIETET